MKKATVTLRSVSPTTFGRFHNTEKLPKELPDAYEKRTWREKLHYKEDTENVVIPATMIGNCIREAAKYLNIPIPGKGKSTYTKNIHAGLIFTNDVVLKIKKNEILGDPRHVPADGRAGGTTL